ncbi:MAG: regulator [Candidatus Thermoplasmatota archaeon]|nr:regulator [Candidatus Thermoplasmatota archaeon]
MWKILQETFEKTPSQLEVVRKLVFLGLSVKLDDENTGHIYCSDIEIKPASLANAVGVDRRAVVEALKKIVRNHQLLDFFSRLTPVANLSASSGFMGMGVIQIVPDQADKPGIIAGVLSIISTAGINVRQVEVDDPQISDDPRAYVVTEAPVPPELLSRMRQVPGVRAIVLM